jgi:integrase
VGDGYRVKANADPFTRHKTRHRGVVFRKRQRGERTYYIYAQGRYLAAGATEKEALARQAELRGKVARGERVLAPAKATFAEVAEEWFETKHRLRPTTRQNYRKSLDNVLIGRFGKRKIGSITVDEIATLIRDLENAGAKPSTINNHLLPLAGTLKFAVRRGLIGVNPYTLLTRDDRPAPRSKPPKYEWSDADADALIEAAERLSQKSEARYDSSPLIRLVFATGLRIGELLGLRWQDIDLDEGALHVERQWTRKGVYGPPKTATSVRRIPLSSSVVAFLREHRARAFARGHARPEDPVFASRDGTPLSHRNVTSRGFAPAARLAALPVSIHNCRDAFASRMIARGVDVVTLSKLMGHANPRITLEVYSHLYDRQRTDEAVREAMG